MSISKLYLIPSEANPKDECSSGIWIALNRSVDEKKYTAHHPPATHHPTKDTLSSAVFPPNFWTNLSFSIDIRLCFLHNFFIYPTIEYFLGLVRLCFPQNFWTNQHFFIGFFYLKSRSNMPENKGLPIFSTPSSPPSFLPNTPTQKNNGRDRSASCYKPWATLGPAVLVGLYRWKIAR